MRGIFQLIYQKMFILDFSSYIWEKTFIFLFWPHHFIMWWNGPTAQPHLHWQDLIRQSGQGYVGQVESVQRRILFPVFPGEGCYLGPHLVASLLHITLHILLLQSLGSCLVSVVVGIAISWSELLVTTSIFIWVLLCAWGTSNQSSISCLLCLAKILPSSYYIGEFLLNYSTNYFLPLYELVS